VNSTDDKAPGTGDDAPLSTILSGIRLSDSFYCKSYCYAPWGFANPPGHGAIFHFVVEGSSTIETVDGETVSIAEGDLALLPRGNGHVLRGQPDAPIASLDSVVQERTGENASRMTIGSTGEQSVLVCGGVSLDPPWHPLFEMLPSIVCLRRNEQEGAPWIEALVSLMGSEVSQDLPGSEAVITRLCEVLVIGTIRNWMLHGIDSSAAWVPALRDRNLGRALARVHQTPSETWTVASLAAEAALSRTVFADRFTEMVGIPPMQYLTHLRMNLAGDMLRGGDHAIGEIAGEIGYSSEVSFSRAFRRFWGKPPGSFRRRPEDGLPFGIRAAAATE